jgi:cytidine deaminase
VNDDGSSGTAAGPTIDWRGLRAAAVAMTGRSYAPYSQVRVGAAALTDDGRVLTGCNVENASSGIGICAEVNLCGHLVASGGGRLVALSVVAGDGLPLSPCGRCRQFLYEFGGPDLLVERDTGIVTLGELLPDAFGPDDLPRRAG